MYIYLMEGFLQPIFLQSTLWAVCTNMVHRPDQTDRSCHRTIIITKNAALSPTEPSCCFYSSPSCAHKKLGRRKSQTQMLYRLIEPGPIKPDLRFPHSEAARSGGIYLPDFYNCRTLQDYPRCISDWRTLQENYTRTHGVCPVPKSFSTKFLNTEQARAITARISFFVCAF